MQNRVRKIRREQDLSQKELAARAEVTRATIANIESGKYHSPSIHTAIKVSAALGLSLGEVFDIETVTN